MKTLSSKESLRNYCLAAFSVTLMLLMSCQTEKTQRIAAALPVPPSMDTVQEYIHTGQTYGNLVTNWDINEADKTLWLQAISQNFPTKIYAGQGYRLISRYSDSVKTLQSFLLEDRDGGQFHVLSLKVDSLNGISLAYQTEKIIFHTDTVTVEGSLHSSLYEAFMDLKETPALAVEMTEIFAWDIDFFKDPRKGDSFSLLVEKRFTPEGKLKGYGPILSARYTNQGHPYAAVRFDGAYYSLEGKSLEKVLLKAPLHYTRVSSCFTNSRLHPILGIRRPHWGIDYAAPMGTKILAAGDGMVEVAQFQGGFGNTVRIRHNSLYTTYYGHLQGFGPGIHAGTRVHQGQVIGFLGMTGLATGPHLDYRVQKSGQFINPAGIKTEAKEGVSTLQWTAFCTQRDGYLTRMDKKDSSRVAYLPKTEAEKQQN